MVSIGLLGILQQSKMVIEPLVYLFNSSLTKPRFKALK